jgi:dTDP-4-amino-4,6-dideoxygalactose transaminase
MDDMMRAVRRLSGRYVPFLQPYWDAEDFSSIAAWLKSGELEDARDKLAERLKLRFPQSANIVLTDTGKSALYVALKMLGIEPGDEVIVPSYCCLSVILSVLRGGCTPVLADTDNQFNLSEEGVVAALSSRVKAILVPHLFGQKAASLEGIIALGRQRGIAVIEDVAQAYGLQLESGALAGSLGDAAIFSAGLGKPIMGPAGGWAVLNRPRDAAPRLEAEPIEETWTLVANFVSRFTGPHWRRGYGDIVHALPSRFQTLMRRKAGFDLRLMVENECRLRGINIVDGWLAARQIERIDRNIELRRQNARRWKALLAKAMIPCTTPPEATNVHAAFPLLFGGPDSRQAAEKFRRVLERGGVATETCYTPLHLRSECRGLRRTEMPFCGSAWQRVFSVPIRPNLTSEDWERIETVVALAGASRASLARSSELVN